MKRHIDKVLQWPTCTTVKMQKCSLWNLQVLQTHPLFHRVFILKSWQQERSHDELESSVSQKSQLITVRARWRRQLLSGFILLVFQLRFDASVTSSRSASLAADIHSLVGLEAELPQWWRQEITMRFPNNYTQIQSSNSQTVKVTNTRRTDRAVASLALYITWKSWFAQKIGTI